MGKYKSTPADREARAAALADIQATIETKMAALTTSDDWKAALDFSAKFHRYSASNVMWLAIQADQRKMALSQVAGFKAWQAMGRQVRKGEKALTVLAPARYPVTDEKTGEKRWIVKGFTTASVFDISQTDGDEIPTVAPRLLVEGGDVGVLHAVFALIEEQGFETLFAWTDTLGAALGVTDFTDKQVKVRSDVEVAQQIKTAVHELAHVLLHEPSKVDYGSNRGRCEVEAESVAYVVLTHLGIAADDYSLPYVAGWSGGDTKVVKATADVVVKTAHQIIEALVGQQAEAVAA